MKNMNLLRNVMSSKAPPLSDEWGVNRWLRFAARNSQRPDKSLLGREQGSHLDGPPKVRCSESAYTVTCKAEPKITEKGQFRFAVDISPAPLPKTRVQLTIDYQKRKILVAQERIRGSGKVEFHANLSRVGIDWKSSYPEGAIIRRGRLCVRIVDPLKPS